MDRKTSSARRLRAPEDAGAAAGSPTSAEPDPEVVAKATRRRFTAAYKLRIVEEAEQCAGEPGAVGKLRCRPSSRPTRGQQLSDADQAVHAAYPAVRHAVAAYR